MRHVLFPVCFQGLEKKAGNFPIIGKIALTLAGVWLASASAIAAPGDLVGWACGGMDADGSVLLVTTNGVDWERQGVGQLSGFLSGVASSDLGDVWVVGNVEGTFAAIYHSQDFGVSWSRQGDASSLPAYDLRKVCAPDDQVVWAVGVSGTVVRTVDGGDTWVTVSVTGPVANLQGVAAIDGQTAWVSGEAIRPGVCALFKTTDGGVNWTLLTNGGTTNTDHLLGMSAVDADHVWAIGGQKTILYSTNGGAYWSTYNHGTLMDGNEIFTLGTDQVYAATDNSVFWSRDNGITWSNHTTADYTMDINTPDGTNIWAVRNSYNGGQIFHSADGGLTWTSQFHHADYKFLTTLSAQRRSALHPVMYVDAAGTNPISPYLSWATAATSIQDAAGMAQDGDAIWVTNGVYDTGGAVTPGYALTNRVCITNIITLRSVNGPSVTFIVGAADPSTTTNGPAAVRCLYVCTNAIVSGFTLANGCTVDATGLGSDREGGGAWLQGGCTLSNCVLTGNSADGDGGGVMGWNCLVHHCIVVGTAAGAGGGVGLDGGAVLENCLIAGNVAADGGGARIEGGTMQNCTLAGNEAPAHGGIYGTNDKGYVYNCVIWSNTSSGGGDDLSVKIGAIQYSCAPTMQGTGCITNNPSFVNAPAGNYRLQADSPCVDSGNNAYLQGLTDLDGIPRPLDGDDSGVAIVDMGCYEFAGDGSDTDADGLSDSNEVYDVGTDPTNPDTDDDWMDDGDEIIADTNPMDSNSYFHMTSVTHGFPTTLYFDSSDERVYLLQGVTDLVDGVWTNVPGGGPRMGVGGADSMDDTNEPPIGSFYRIEVQLP